MQQATHTRRIQYDLLRIWAAFSVVMLHCAAQYWYGLPVTGRTWKIINAYDACFRFGVPVFVMISGAIFLDPARELDVKHFYRHNILRLVILYVLWSCLYGLQVCDQQGIGNMEWKQILVTLSRGRYHLWYLPMLVGIYVLLPVLRSWILHAEKQNIRYFLRLFLLLQILRTTVIGVVENKDILRILELGEIPMVCSYLGYFVLGYYMVHVGLTVKYHRFLYLSVIPSAAVNILVSTMQSVRDGFPHGEIYDSFGIFTFLITVATFQFFSEIAKKDFWGRGSRTVVEEIARGTLGIYLMHIAAIDLLKPLIDKGMHPVVGTPVLAVATFLVCYMASALLRRIPVVGRYLC